jgi:hypothetical protein
MSSAPNSLSQLGRRPGSSSLRKVTTPGRLTEAIAKELNECLCAIVINTGTCLRMLSADPPNVEGACKTARRTISCTNRAAEAVSHLCALFSETSKRIENVAPSKGGSSRVATGGSL